MRNWVIIFFGIVFVGASCGSLKKANRVQSNTESLRMYNPSVGDIHPDYTIYHNSSDESTLFFRVFTQELLFNQANAELKDQARLLIEYKLYSSYSEGLVAHEDRHEFVINKDDVPDNYVGSIKFPTEEGISYLLEVTLIDLLRQSRDKSFHLVDRFNPKSQQNYLFVAYPGSQVAFEHFFYAVEKFRIVRPKAGQGKVRVAYFKPIRELPLPPFSVNVGPQSAQPEPDSLFAYEINDQSLFQMKDPGVYVYYLDEGSMDGAFACNFGDEFPKISAAEDMLPPLQYLTTSSEYKELISTSNLKEGVDEFWLDRGGSFGAARELIRVFYNRVVFSNLYFSTDRPGWKTDQGMIYLLFGPPDLVTRSETGETWAYKMAGTNQKYTFDFYLEADPIIGYRFTLKRTENHRNIWNQAVRSWRQGKIFSLR